jgi:flagellar motor switch protein FliM
VPLHVLAELKAQLTARELIELQTGDVLSLGVPIQTAVDVRVRSLTKFRGQLVRGEHSTGISIVEQVTESTQAGTERVDG